MADAKGCISTCTTEENVYFTVISKGAFSSSSGEEAQSVHWRRSVAETRSRTGEVAVRVFAVMDTVCFTVKFIDAK